ncbi:TIR domain-containing protein [Streptomyces sp. Act143]|uniref:toll/interleukin-1 receptor domain-containing protein n=1 Tax=Streptomyces sp. Act143 TaxID=2200760 RepID=UPI000D683EC0|nr:toll/interleukin-1 receptor domain-containing protein [Streptomyces sp. Act143]PWI19785.1 TIR domain-containing protein [Streptomyces sp. Act143]
MPDIFINYRTGDGEHLATILDRELSHRFGPAVGFRASKSIKPGQKFAAELLRGVRRSSVLLAVIGPGWTASPALHDEDDWVRREILEAFQCGIPVVPVLGGRRMERLRDEDLPAPLAQLAEIQSLRYDNQNAEADLDRIVAELVDLVPELAKPEQPDRAAPTGEAGDVRNEVGRGARGPVFQGRDFSGDVGGTVIKNNSGPVHAGKGDQNNHYHRRPELPDDAR